MSNGHANCIFAVCCPPESEERVKALAEEMGAEVKLGGGAEYEGQVLAPPYAVAKYVLDNYDLAPKGSLTPLYAEIARLARQGYAQAPGQPVKPPRVGAGDHALRPDDKND